VSTLRILRRCVLAACLSAVSFAASAQQLTIITSFPKDWTEVYTTAYEPRNRG
jgi:hypothetical protein